MENLKSSYARLAGLFKNGRDKWREKSHEKQKKLRFYEIKIRDLCQSRDSWKKTAKNLEKELKEQKKKILELKEITYDEKKLIPPKTDIVHTSSEQAYGHKYSMLTVQLSLQLIINALTSYRGAGRTFEVLSQYFEVETPSFGVIRQWMYRIGLYMLSSSDIQENIPKNNRVIILDHTIQSGHFKCLVILETLVDKVIESNFSLTHQDVEVADIKIMTTSNGYLIGGILKDLKHKLGSFAQIVIDGGSDLKKGTAIFIEENVSTVYTYDVTHAVAAIVKSELGNDEIFVGFLKKCSSTISKLQQTQLSFLIPPSQRNKSLYLNISRYIDWAANMLQYQKKEDFSLIEINNKTDISCLEKINEEAILNIPANSTEALKLKEKNRTDYIQKIYSEKLDWINEYEKELDDYKEISNIVRTVQTQIKTEGINQQSSIEFIKSINSSEIKSDCANKIKNKVIDYLNIEGSKIPEKQSLLGTSDIIESVFGKQKNFTEKSPVKEIGKMVLMIPLIVGNKLKDSVFLKKALESVRYADVKKWSQENFGQTARSKRLEAFKNIIETTPIEHENPIANTG